MSDLLRELYENHAADVHRFATWLCGDPALADDITSETFVLAWNASAPIREATVRSYLFSIARNVYLQELRRTSRLVELPEAVRLSSPGPEERVDQSRALRAVLRALQQLPEVDRAALLLRTQEGLPYDEIAGILKLSLSAVKVKVHRAPRCLETHDEPRRRDAMKLDREVIQDLLPLYLAGEANPGTRALLEDYLRQNPEFAGEVQRQAARSAELLTGAPPTPPPPDLEKATLVRARRLARNRTYLLGFAIGYTLMPLGCVVDASGVRWIMARDNPHQAVWFLLAALGCWVGWYLMGRRLRAQA